jgi:hypothetical protein
LITLQRQFCENSFLKEMIMTISLRVVGVYFKEDINITVTPTTTIKSVMDEAQRLFPGFSYEASAGGTLYSVTNKVSGSSTAYTLRDSDRKRKPVKPGEAFTTWQSYITRDGTAIGLDGVFTPFGSRQVEDGDAILWRLVTVAKRFS